MDEKTKKMIDPDEIDEMEEEQVPESEAEELEETAFTEESEVVDLPMIPLRGLSVFPNMVLHFDIGREKSINALEKAMIMDQHIFLASQKDDETDLPTPDDFYHIGTIGKIKQMLKLPGHSRTGRRHMQRTHRRCPLRSTLFSLQSEKNRGRAGKGRRCGSRSSYADCTDQFR